MADHPEIQFAIQQAFQQLEVEKIEPWAFFLSGKMKPIESFNGKIIRYSGIAFDGSPRIVFWQDFIQPFIEAIYVWAFDMAISHSERRGADKAGAIQVARQSLSDGTRAIFKRMQDIDRKLRGGGFPAKVPLREISAEINQMYSKLDLYFKSAEEATERNTSKLDTPTLSDAMELKPGLWGFNVDLKKVFEWFRAGKGTGNPTGNSS